MSALYMRDPGNWLLKVVITAILTSIVLMAIGFARNCEGQVIIKKGGTILCKGGNVGTILPYLKENAMKKSASRKNKECRRRKGKMLLCRRNIGISPSSKLFRPLTKAERKTMYKWKLLHMGMFNKRTTPRARKAAIKELDRKLGFGKDGN
jgi:hypothetical protein